MTYDTVVCLNFDSLTSDFFNWHTGYSCPGNVYFTPTAVYPVFELSGGGKDRGGLSSPAIFKTPLPNKLAD